MNVRSVLLFVLVTASCGDEKTPAKGNPVVASASDAPRLNRLAREKSPYLRQHATNPVEWYPWGDEAFAKAKEEDKPVFLSIGYSSCHWCHVMEHESFADEEVAAVLNQHYVSVKVDREERPDVDEIYMKAAVALMRGRGGGWPLSVWLTPDRKPFVAGTYFPKYSTRGMPGFVDVLQQIAAAWNDPQRRLDIVRTGDQVVEFLQGTIHEAGDSRAIGLAEVETAVGYAVSAIDPEWGGFGNEPKFPSPTTVELLLRAALRKRDPELLKHVTLTLDHMARGGIHDHVGGGFHRYSVTRNWRVPHFEKMLYDNAQLLALYAWAYLATLDPLYATTARDIARWVRREMTNEHGGFFSAQDADDPGGPEGEGGFYVWDPAEIRTLFGDKEAAVVLSRFDITDSGNWFVQGQQEKPGKTLLEVRRTVAEVAKDTGVAEGEVEAILAAAILKMYAAREGRPKPMTDEKALSAWNGLMISGLARAYQALGDDDLLDSAVRGGTFVREHLMHEGRLLRRWMEGEAAHAAVLDDYAYVIAAFLDIYETTFEVEWLREALRLNDIALELFYDDEEGGFFYTSADGEQLIARSKPIMDNARPSGNAVMVYNLLRVAELTGNHELRRRAEDTIRLFGGKTHEAPLGMSHLLNAVAFAVSEPRQIFIAGDRGSLATRALVEAVWRDPDPNRVIVLVTPGIEELLPPAAGKGKVDGNPAAYVCRNYTCQAPVTDPAALAGARPFEAERESGR